MYTISESRPVLQDWVTRLPMMQQTVLLTAVRGPDGLPKYHPTKYLLRWYRRCILLSAMDGKVLSNPYDVNGGSFTGPSLSFGNPYLEGLAPVWDETNWQKGMDQWVTEYLRSLDQVPLHFHLHFLHAVEILGYKHRPFDSVPVNYQQSIHFWWRQVYIRFVDDMHLHPESEAEMDARLGDSREGWLARGDVATND